MIIKFDENIAEIIDRASKIICRGGVVILPFDTVYGFACDPTNESALQRIYELKKRPEKKTIGLAASSIADIKKIADLNISAEKYITEKTPGRYTFIVKGKPSNISDFCIQNGTIGTRIPDSKLILKIAEKCGGLIAQTSANISGRPNCYSIEELRKQYSDEALDKIELIVDGGELENLGASKLVDLTGDVPTQIERS